MILARKELLKKIGASKNQIQFHPPIAKEEIDQVSIDLRLGNKFIRFKEPPAHIATVYANASLLESDLWESSEAEEYTLDPGGFVLAQTLEKVSLPADIVGFVEGRSTWARLGVTVHVTAPKIDPGFSGHIALEMANFGRCRICLRARLDKPCQLILFKTTSRVAKKDLYGTKKTDRYQLQDSPLPGHH
jgi:dCTP deaminase